MAAPTVTEYQTRVYTLLQQIPSGRIASYASLSKALDSSPRAVGGALRRNPFAPEVPCHRVIAASGVGSRSAHVESPSLTHSDSKYIGGFKGDWEKAPSGINCEKKLELLKTEGVEFDAKGMLADKSRWWNEFRP
ncbi:MAG: hypothetical protein M1821_007617 [Bathelium mastoideum]|nr:MAG: hypothetical protein M1821_007617 [Bathelium mastoideum]